MKTTSSSASNRKRSSSAKSRKNAISVSLFTEIKREHALFRKAMTRIRKLYGKDPERAKTAYHEFRAILQAHAKAEEQTLYSVLLAKSEPGQELDSEVREGKEEHHVADFLVNELNQIPATDPKWEAKFHVLVESVEHHLDEEEAYFGHWKKKLNADENREIHDQFVSRRASLIAESPAVRH